MTANRTLSVKTGFKFLCLIVALLSGNLTTVCAVEKKPLKVFLLVGQSNMEGKGNPIHLDTYKDDPAIKATYEGLKDGDGWAVRAKSLMR